MPLTVPHPPPRAPTPDPRLFPLAARGHLPCALRGRALLGDSFYNKGAAFSHAERDAFGLHGLLPRAVHALDEQVVRAYGQYLACRGKRDRIATPL